MPRPLKILVRTLLIVALLAVAVPFGSTWSLDHRRAVRRRGGEDQEPTVAAAWVWLVRAQVAVVYAFAGLAKLQADWLVRAEPLRFWLPARRDLLPLVGRPPSLRPRPRRRLPPATRWPLLPPTPPRARKSSTAHARIAMGPTPFSLKRRSTCDA